MNQAIHRYCVLQGAISQLRTDDIHVHYEKNISQQQEIAGAVAVLQAVTGQAGAISSAQAATYEGDPVHGFVMQVAGRTVCGSFWKATFKDGDHVQVIGEDSAGVFKAVAVAKPEERIIWMQPHCECGTHSRKRGLLKYSGWFGFVMFLCALLMTIFQGWPIWFALVSFCIVTPTILFVTVGLSWRSFMAFSGEMNAVGEALGLPQPERINLFDSTRRARKAGRPELPMGVYYY